jgi:hypothetical protein
MAAVRDIAGSGAIDEAARAPVDADVASFFSGVRSLAGVEFGAALDGGWVEATSGPLYPL